MSSASMPRRCSSSWRISFVHGSAPSTATFSEVERGSMPSFTIASAIVSR